MHFETDVAVYKSIHFTCFAAIHVNGFVSVTHTHTPSLSLFKLRAWPRKMLYPALTFPKGCACQQQVNSPMEKARYVDGQIGWAWYMHTIDLLPAVGSGLQ